MSMLIALDPCGIDLAYPDEVKRRSGLGGRAEHVCSRACVWEQASERESNMVVGRVK